MAFAGSRPMPSQHPCAAHDPRMPHAHPTPGGVRSGAPAPMAGSAPAPSPDDFCGTFYAARWLGLSVATVQSLVERGDLRAWKTKGGHRRISLSSLRAYLEAHGSKVNATTWPDACIRVLIVDDDTATREMMDELVSRWKLPVDCTVMASAMEAMVDIHSLRPDILFTNLNMPGVDGLALLRTLRANPAFEHLMLVASTGLSQPEIEARGGLPSDTIVVERPVSAPWLRGFVTGLATQRTLQAASKR